MIRKNKKKLDKDFLRKYGYLYVYGEEIVKLVLILIAICGLIGGCSYLNKHLDLKNDNPIEQSLEKIIEQKLDISIDLSPNDDV